MPERILIVEDSRTQAEALRALLEEEGYLVEIALEGESALGQARAFDVVLSDVLMPGMSGYDLCRKIKSGPDNDGPLVVLLTSLGDPRDIVRGLEAGADNYVTKPYEPERLKGRIRHVLENRALRRRGGTPTGIPIRFEDETFTIDAGRGQILDLLLSSFQELVRTNEALESSERALAETVKREQRARAAAEEATRAREEVMAMVSHDLRNPLNAIVGNIEILLDVMPDELGPPARERIELIGRVAGQMDGLIQDLLDVTSIEAGHLTLERESHEVEPLVREAVQMLEPSASRRSQELRVRVETGIAPVDADRSRLTRVLSNLIGNALEYSPESASVEVEARSAEGGAEILFSVRDEGPGIDPAARERIFEPFWQAERGEQEEGTGRGGGPRRGGGAGLGLAIARGIVEAHGGRIWVESEVGSGSTFHFTVAAAGGREAGAS